MWVKGVTGDKPVLDATMTRFLGAIYSAVPLLRGQCFPQILKKVIASPLERGIGCILWVQTVVYTLPQSLQWYMQYHVILDRIITALDCMPLYYNTLTTHFDKAHHHLPVLPISTYINLGHKIVSAIVANEWADIDILRKRININALFKSFHL